MNRNPVNESRLFATSSQPKASVFGGIPVGYILHTGGVASSILAAPTKQIKHLAFPAGSARRGELNRMAHDTEELKAVAVALELFGPYEPGEAVDQLAERILDALQRVHTSRLAPPIDNLEPPIAKRPPETNGSVYILQSEGGERLIKIGYTTVPFARFKDLASSSPYPLVLHALYAGTREMESDVLEKFWEHRVSGEWFRPAPEIIEFAKNVPLAYRRSTYGLNTVKVPAAD